MTKTLVPHKKDSKWQFDIMQSFFESCTNIKTNKPCDDSIIDLYFIREIIQNLPGANSAIELVVDLIFGTGMRFYSSNPDTDKTEVDGYNTQLDNFLKQKNPVGQTNLNVLRTAVWEYEALGHTAIRPVELDNQGFLMNLAPEKWIRVMLKTNIRGIKKTLLYIVDEKAKRKVEFKEDEVVSKIDEMFGIEVNENGVISVSDDIQNFYLYYLLPDELTVLSLNAKDDYGVSPFMSDRQRIQLAIDAYWANINDINQDGFGKIILKIREDINTLQAFGVTKEEYNANPRATAEMIAQSLKRNNQELAKSIKGAGARDSVSTINGAVYEDVKVLPREVKATEYLQVMQDAIAISANALGIDPSLLGAKDTAYKSSTGEILRHTVLNVMPPRQERLASQVEQTIKKLLGISRQDIHIRFQPFDLTDQKEKAEVERLVSETAKNMFGVGITTTDTTSYLADNLDQDLELPDTPERFINRSYEPIDNSLIN